MRLTLCLLACIATLPSTLSAQTAAASPAPPPPSSHFPLHVHAIVSVADAVSNLSGGLNDAGGLRLAVAIDGVPMMLQTSFHFHPIAPGEYPGEQLRHESPRGEIQRRYKLQLTADKSAGFTLTGLCERGATVCFGFSVPPSN